MDPEQGVTLSLSKTNVRFTSGLLLSSQISLGGREDIFMIINYAMVLNVKYLHRNVPVYQAIFI